MFTFYKQFFCLLLLNTFHSALMECPFSATKLYAIKPVVVDDLALSAFNQGDVGLARFRKNDSYIKWNITCDGDKVKIYNEARKGYLTSRNLTPPPDAVRKTIPTYIAPKDDKNLYQSWSIKTNLIFNMGFNNMVLDVTGADYSVGNSVGMYPSHNFGNQEWNVELFSDDDDDDHSDNDNQDPSFDVFALANTQLFVFRTHRKSNVEKIDHVKVHNHLNKIP